ncbi:MAG TPA: cation-transporting P-type ATPase, partial [Bacteroidia bacterium]|nr:cation-transporting P-type ATPase [Bacteroidia bacterium]
MITAEIPGLTSVEAAEQLKKSGYNELQSARPKNIFRIAIGVLKEPMFILLLSCGALYLFIGDYKEGLILGTAIFLIIGITFYQSRKTERALEALKKLSSPRATVLRDGEMKKIPGREIVPSDILILNEGDRIAADGT